MIRKSVQSSNIVSIGYDEVLYVLEVEFIGSGIYQYADIPKEIYESFIKADSVGKFFYANIKGKYSYSKI